MYLVNLEEKNFLVNYKFPFIISLLLHVSTRRFTEELFVFVIVVLLSLLLGNVSLVAVIFLRLLL